MSRAERGLGHQLGAQGAEVDAVGRRPLVIDAEDVVASAKSELSGRVVDNDELAAHVGLTAGRMYEGEPVAVDVAVNTGDGRPSAAARPSGRDLRARSGTGAVPAERAAPGTGRPVRGTRARRGGRPGSIMLRHHRARRSCRVPVF